MVPLDPSETSICGESVPLQTAKRLLEVLRNLGLVDSAVGAKDFGAITKVALQALPHRAGRKDLLRYRGMGLQRLAELEELLELFGVFLAEKIESFSPRRADFGTYFTGPPNTYGHYWWRPHGQGEGVLREVNAESNPADLVRGLWSGPLQAPPVPEDLRNFLLPDRTPSYAEGAE